MALHADQKWTDSKSQDMIFHRMETLFQSPKSDSPPRQRIDWLKPEQRQGSAHTYLDPDKTNLSLVHVNAGTHRGTVQIYNIYNREGCIHVSIHTLCYVHSHTPNVTNENEFTDNRFTLDR